MIERDANGTRAMLKAVHPVLMVRDIAASLRFYACLGFEQSFVDSAEQPMYAGVRRDGLELHLQWHDASEWSYPNDRPIYRFVVDEVDRLSEGFSAENGITDRTKVWDTDWGTREFHVRDPDGNGLQFYWQPR